MQIEISHPGTVAVPAPIGETTWRKLDKLGAYIFAVVILVGGMFTPLGLAIYSLLFRNIE